MLTPTREAPGTRQGLVHARAYDGIFSDKEKKPATFKLKKTNVKQTQPGNWKESEITGTPQPNTLLRRNECVLMPPLLSQTLPARRLNLRPHLRPLLSISLTRRPPLLSRRTAP